MTKLQAIREFMNTVCGEPIVIAKKRDEWSIDVWETYPRLILPTDLRINDEEDKLFRKDFIERYRPAKGFSNVTLSLLHEAGHWFTRYDVDWEAYYDDRKDKYGMDYFRLEAEMKATDWAIAWLSDANNRKLAKWFELAYCGY